MNSILLLNKCTESGMAVSSSYIVLLHCVNMHFCTDLLMKLHRTETTVTYMVMATWNIDNASARGGEQKVFYSRIRKQDFCKKVGWTLLASEKAHNLCSVSALNVVWVSIYASKQLMERFLWVNFCCNQRIPERPFRSNSSNLSASSPGWTEMRIL